jgi:type VI secretion system secreted protein VgrG
VIERSAQLEIDGVDAELRVVRVVGHARWHEPAWTRITLAAIAGDGSPLALEPEQLFGHRAELRIARADGSASTTIGVVDAIQSDYAELTVTIVPRAALLADTSDFRVFVDEDAHAIALTVLSEHGIDIERRLARTASKRPQCVQAFESDLRFVQRLLAEEGAAFFFEHDSGKDVMVFVDAPSSVVPIDGDDALRLAPDAGLRADEHVTEATLSYGLVPEKFRLRDYDVTRPLADLTKDASADSGAGLRFEYPAGTADPGTLEELARIRLEEARAEHIVLSAVTTSRRMAVGRTFRLLDAPRGDMAGPWLVVELGYDLSDDGAKGANAASDVSERFRAEIVCVPAQSPHRPTRIEAPALGVQTATATGPSGSEIHTDELGRCTALLRWDRRRASDDHASAWLRPLEPQTSGSMYLPRVGWDLLLGYSGPSADMPLPLGRLDHGAAPPAEALPAHKVRSAFGSRTTPGGGSANVLRTDDTAGSEGMDLTASYDYNELTQTHKTVDVTSTDTITVGTNRSLIVGKTHEVGVEGAQTYIVGATRTVDVGANLTFASASESISVGGTRTLNIGGDCSTKTAVLTRIVGGPKVATAIEAHNRHVSGAETLLVGGDWNELGGVVSACGVGGAHLRAVAGAWSVHTPSFSMKASSLHEGFGAHTVRAGLVQDVAKGSASLKVGGSASLKGSKVVVNASSSLVIKAAGTTIQLTPSSITVKGALNSSVASVVTGTEKNE